MWVIIIPIMTIMLEDWQAFTDFKSKNIEAERNKDSGVR